MSEEPQVSWLEDGHKIIFRLEKDEVILFDVKCPFEGRVGICNQNRDNCAVDDWCSVYGTEINIGAIEIDGPIEIAWSPVLGECDIDRNFSQLWITPVEDPSFRAWKILNNV